MNPQHLRGCNVSDVLDFAYSLYWLAGLGKSNVSEDIAKELYRLVLEIQAKLNNNNEIDKGGDEYSDSTF